MLGQKLGGRYQISSQLSPGGFGVTFVAVDTQRPGNPKCVVKQLKPRATDPYTLREAKRLFDQEAEILEALGKHNQIPQLLAHFEENQEFFLVQEYIEGHDLSREIPPIGRLLSEAEVISLLTEILEVLAFVHQHNVIHRDIKPANIRRRNDGKIVLIDFGAVKQISTQIANSQGQTNFTIAIGTVGYMPSEQANHNPQFSSDIYAVGMIGIQALTGISPQQLKPDVSTGEIIWCDRTQLRVSPELANILDKMIRYDFRQRYQTAAAALQDFHQSFSAVVTPISSHSTHHPTGQKQRFQTRQFFISGLGMIVVFATLFVVITKVKTTPEKLSPTPYNNNEIKINYPETWAIQNTPNAISKDVVEFLSPKQSPTDNFPTRVTISIEEPVSETLEQYKKSEIDNTKKLVTEANILDEDCSQTLAKREACQLIYTGKEGVNTVKFWKIWVFNGDRAYIITYAAKKDEYDKFSPTVEQMIKSFEIH